MSRKIFTRLINLSQASGIEVNINLVLAEKPVREEQKLKTLTKYVQRYPSGWKKRLELADLLFGMGKLYEALEEYRRVIERQPQLISIQLKVGKILQLIAREKEAIEVYKIAFSLVSSLKFSSSALSNLTQSYMATQSHIIGLIEVCRHNFPKAVEAFESATTFEPDNPSHWLALGQLQRSIGNKIDALRAFEAILSRYPDDIIALINIYDVLIALGDAQSQLASNLEVFNQEKSQKEAKKRRNLLDNIWYNQTEKILNQAIALAPDNYQVLKRQIEYRCRIKLVSGTEGKQTKQLLNTLLKLASNSADVYQLTTYYYQVRGEIEKGVTLLQQFTDKHPYNPRGWYYYGMSLLQLGDTQRATEAIEKAHQLSPKDREIEWTLCEMLSPTENVNNSLYLPT
ncbi:MAG: tetratricopeptide repeat protein [Prochloraceae cyanobacterium]|nr:tetratricopeptide repeat protein [Prochloraceae cyanobacterium]